MVTNRQSPPLTPIIRLKVLAYITRDEGEQRLLLVQTHRDQPEAGLQVPAGTVEPGEAIEAALWREIEEESGLTEAGGLRLVRQLAIYRWWSPAATVHIRHVYHLQAPTGLPERWSHEVSAGEDDKGLVFEYQWMPIAEAMGLLAVDQGDWLDAIR